MGGLPWYKRYPDNALTGMMDLPLEQRGAYCTVLELIYSKGNKLLDDDRHIADWCRCDIRVWRRIKKALIEKEKISIVDGEIHNGRADGEVLRALSSHASSQESGRKGGHKSGVVRRKNKGLAEASLPEKTNHVRRKSKEDSDSSKEEEPARHAEPELELKLNGTAVPLTPITTNGGSPPSIRKAMWTDAQYLLGDKCRSLVGRSVRDHGLGSVAEALDCVRRNEPADPKAYFIGHLKKRPSAQKW